MEKRKTTRHKTETPIICSYMASRPSVDRIEGRVRNCCRNGLYAELNAHFSVGTIIMIRTVDNSRGYAGEEGLRSLTLAEVRWSEKMVVHGQICYGTGLRYVMT